MLKKFWSSDQGFQIDLKVKSLSVIKTDQQIILKEEIHRYFVEKISGYIKTIEKVKNTRKIKTKTVSKKSLSAASRDFVTKLIPFFYPFITLDKWTHLL